MKRGLLRLFALGVVCCAMRASAVVRYVDLNSSFSTPPYTNWSTAATNIQDAVDVAANGDTVLVTNGVYATGGQRWFDSGTNRLTVTNSLILRSVNGPAVTFIQGYHGPATNAARCALLTTNAVLSGFTLTNGQSGIGNYPQGGGVYCYSLSATISNCVLAGNLANYAGGGAYGGTLVNCVLDGNSATNSGGGAYNSALVNCFLLGNSARNGGGAYSGTLTNCILLGNSATVEGGGTYTLNNDPVCNCTIVSNTADSGGGVREGRCYNCVIYYNRAASFPNGHPLLARNCCTIPLQGGTGNITNGPAFANLGVGDLHLQSNSPCINSGFNAYSRNSADSDGNQRIVGGTVDIGAYEFQSPASVLSYAWAQQYGLATDGSADFVDSDGDGFNNWQEWRAGTVPTDSASALRLSSPTSALTSLSISWQSVTNRTYWLERATNLSSLGLFLTVATNIPGQSGTTTFLDSSATNSNSFFYRVGAKE